MKNSFSISVILDAAPGILYEAWLSSNEHGAFIGDTAKIAAKVGGKFSIWDGYITGKTIELEPPGRIVQTWRTTEFPEDAPDSKIEILITKTKNGSKLTINHSELPPGEAPEYKQGWKEYYFVPMKEYFKNKK